MFVTAAVKAAAQIFLDESEGKVEYALLLDATKRGIETNLMGRQNMIAPISLDFINVPAAKIGAYVWLDDNGNGIHESGEPGLNGVTVNLLDASDEVIATTTTANDDDGNPGYYQFVIPEAGTYAVQFVVPDDYEFSSKDADEQGLAGEFNSDADPFTGKTDTVTLQVQPTGGDVVRYVGAGLYQQGRLGGFVWLDSNGDGIWGDDEAGIAGATATLYSSDGVKLVESQRTDGEGLYLFTRQPPGDYTIRLTPPAGYLFSPGNVTASGALQRAAYPTDGKLVTATLTSGQIDLMSGTASVLPKVAAGAVRTDKSDLSVPLTNNTRTQLTLKSVKVAWPAGNGKLQRVLLDGKSISNAVSASNPVTITQYQGTTGDRSIGAGASKSLVLRFQRNVLTGPYRIELSFTDGSTVRITDAATLTASVQNGDAGRVVAGGNFAFLAGLQGELTGAMRARIDDAIAALKARLSTFGAQWPEAASATDRPVWTVPAPAPNIPVAAPNRGPSSLDSDQRDALFGRLGQADLRPAMWDEQALDLLAQGVQKSNRAATGG